MKKIRILTSILLTAAVMLSFGGCLKYTSNILEVTTAGTLQPDVTTQPQVPVTDVTTVPAVTDPSQATTVPAVTDAPTTSPAQQGTDPTTWSTQEIIDFTSKAVNQTKGYTGNLTAAHTENISVNVTKAPGGSAIQGIINPIIEGIIEPTDETLNFTNGSAVNSEGETVSIVLPKSGAFSLDTAGVVSAKAYAEGTDIVVEITLIAERGTMDAVPHYNSTAVGYLDIASLDISAITITKMDVDYTGSTMKIRINPSGYVVTADYSVPFVISAAGKAAFISADLGIEGNDSEHWELKW